MYGRHTYPYSNLASLTRGVYEHNCREGTKPYYWGYTQLDRVSKSDPPYSIDKKFIRIPLDRADTRDSAAFYVWWRPKIQTDRRSQYAEFGIEGRNKEEHSGVWQRGRKLFRQLYSERENDIKRFRSGFGGRDELHLYAGTEGFIIRDLVKREFARVKTASTVSGDLYIFRKNGYTVVAKDEDDGKGPWIAALIASKSDGKGGWVMHTVGYSDCTSIDEMYVEEYDYRGHVYRTLGKYRDVMSGDVRPNDLEVWCAFRDCFDSTQGEPRDDDIDEIVTDFDLLNCMKRLMSEAIETRCVLNGTVVMDGLEVSDRRYFITLPDCELPAIHLSKHTNKQFKAQIKESQNKAHLLVMKACGIARKSLGLGDVTEKEEMKSDLYDCGVKLVVDEMSRQDVKAAEKPTRLAMQMIKMRDAEKYNKGCEAANLALFHDMVHEMREAGARNDAIDDLACVKLHAIDVIEMFDPRWWNDMDNELLRKCIEAGRDLEDSRLERELELMKSIQRSEMKLDKMKQLESSSSGCI